MKKREIKEILKQFDTVSLPRTARKQARKRPVLALCAICVLLMLTVAACAEIHQYRTAVTFFRNSGLSTEGLTWGEIRQIYEDIKTERFVYGKTAEVLHKNMILNSVPGYEITRIPPTAEEVERMWSLANSIAVGTPLQTYEIGSEYRMDPALGFEVLDYGFIRRYCDGKVLWCTEVPFWIENYEPQPDGGVLIYGRNDTHSSAEKTFAYLASIDADGTVLWQIRLENGFDDEYIAAVLPEEDHIAVFSRGDLQTFCFSRIGWDGTVLHTAQTEIDNYGIWNTAKLGDGYLVRLGNYSQTPTDKIVKVSAEGELTDEFRYTSAKRDYVICDMVEYNGAIYLSAYATPPRNGKSEHTYIWETVEANFGTVFKISEEELTPILQDIYSAVLLVCDKTEGTPQEFYTVNGALGGTLTVQDSQLHWDVDNLVHAYPSPATSSFSFGGTSVRDRYIFDGEGLLLREETEEMTGFRR